jgi:hypothetical protein
MRPQPVTQEAREVAEMKKKSKADVAKMVDAQAKGKKVKGAGTDKKTPQGGELDTRISKATVKW